MTKIATRARNAAGSAITGLIEVGERFANGFIEIRSGAPPANPQIPATGTLLAKLQLSSPAFGNYLLGTANSNAIIPDEDIDNSGEATWLRIYDKNGSPVIDATISLPGGGGDIEFDNTRFIKGGTVQMISLSAIMPE